MLPVVITAFADKSFTFILKSPPASVLIRKALKTSLKRYRAARLISIVVSQPLT